MGIAIAVAIALLIFGGVIAVIVIEVKRYGWNPVLRYIFFAIVIRVFIHASMPDAGKTKNIAIPLFGAAVITWLWPYVVVHRMRDNEKEIEPDPQDELK